MTLKEELSADRRKFLEVEARKQFKKKEALNKEAEYIINEIIEPTFRKLHYRAREEKFLQIKCMHVNNKSFEVSTKPYCNLTSEFRYSNPNLDCGKVWDTVVDFCNQNGYYSRNLNPIKSLFILELDD